MKKTICLRSALCFLLMTFMIVGTLFAGTVGVAAEGESAAPALPKAKVESLGSIEIEEYDIYNGSLTEGTTPITLQVAMEFVSEDTEETAKANAYADYTTDFYITINGPKGGSFEADGCYLAGHYGEFGWIMIPLDDMVIEFNKVYPVISSVGFDFSYVDICTSVKDFKCGIFFSDEILEAYAGQGGLGVKLELGLSENLEKAQAAEFTLVDKPYQFVAVDTGNGYALEATDKLPEVQLPNADVKSLGLITIDDYDIYNGSLTSGTTPITLQVAMEFIATDTEAEAEANAYGNYITDFYITINDDGTSGTDSFYGTGCYLAGHYGDFGWIMIPLDDMEIQKGKTYPVISSVGFEFSYVDICTSVKDFKCGIFFSDEVLAANPGLDVTLALGLSETVEKAQNAEFVTVDEPYQFEAVKDANGNFVLEEVVAKKAVAQIGETGYATLEEAFAAAQNGDTVELLADTYEDIVIPAEFGGTLAIGNCTINSITNNSATAKIVINGNVVVENANGSAITGEYINISGNGTLTAIANGDHAYGIGGDNTKSITIENVHILKVQGGHYGEIGTDTKYYKDAPEGGAGIGSGCNGAVITLTNVTIDEALGGSKAAGIGALYHTGVTINITGCEIAYVEGGATAAGIGGSRVSSDATASEAVIINIQNSTITAVGGVYAAGIGSGYDTHCQANQPICTINIDGSTIKATGGQYAAGIGTGYHNAGLAGEIKNSTITAASGDKVYKDKYTSAQDIGFGVADLAREGSNNDSYVIYNGTKIALPRNVAQIGETKYQTLADALAAAKDGETITFLADINESVTVNKAVIIDGAGKTYTGTMTLSANINFTVTNVNFVNGTVIKGKNTAWGGTYTFKNCNFKGDSLMAYAIELRATESIIIEDCEAEGYAGFLQVPSSNHSITVKNVEVDAIYYGFKIDYSGEGNSVYMENVTVTAGEYALYHSNFGAKTYTIKNCNLSSIKLWNRETGLVDTFKFEGANTVGELASSEYVKYVLANKDATLTAPEGLNVTAEAGYTVKYIDGKYVVKANMVAIGDETYASLAEAIAAAKAGDTITFLADINESVTVNKAVIIDGAGFQYIGTMKTTANISLTIQNVNFVKGRIDADTSAQQRELTIKDCTFDGVDKSIGYAITVRHGKSVVIEGCSAKNYGTGMLYVPQSVTTITVKDVTVSDVLAAFNISYSGDSTFENVTLSNVTYGLHVQNHGTRTFTLKGCQFDTCQYPIYVQAKGTAIVKFAIADQLTLTTTEGTKYAQFVLADAKATLKAPEGLTVTAHHKCYKVSYENGVYSASLAHTEETIPAVAPTYESVGYTEGTKCSVCDEILVAPEEIAMLAKVQIPQSSLELKDAINLKFSVLTSSLIEGKTDYVAIVTKYYADGRDPVSVTIPYDQWTLNGKGTYMTFLYEGISAKEMADTVTVVIYDGDLVASDVREDGVTAYVQRAIKGGVFTEEKYAKLATLLVDLLNYGTAAQNEWSYNVDNPANSIVADYQSFATKTDPEFGDNIAVDASAEYWGTTVSLKDRVVLNFNFKTGTLDNAAKAIITFTDHYGKVQSFELDKTAFKASKDGSRITIAVTQLAAADARCVVTCTFVDAEGNAIEGLYAKDSIANYCARAINSLGSDSPKAVIYKSIVRYADAAAAHFDKES